jgi:hypothetical protein
MLTRKRAIYAKIEAAPGVMEALTSTEVVGIIAYDVKFDPDIKMYARKPMLSTLSPVAQVPGARSGKFTFKTELKGPAAAYSALVKPAFSIFARACALGETIVTTVGSESAAYQVASSSLPKLSIWSNLDGEVKKLYGAVGNCKLEGKTGEPAFLSWEFTGVFAGVADLALPTVSYEMSEPPVMLGAAFTLGGQTFKIDKFSIDLGNTVELVPSMNSADGWAYADITGRQPMLGFDPEAVSVATYDFYGKWRSGAKGALVIGPIGSQNYNRFTIAAPVCTYTKVGEGDRNGLYTYDAQAALSMSGGDDEFVLTMPK